MEFPDEFVFFLYMYIFLMLYIIYVWKERKCQALNVDSLLGKPPPSERDTYLVWGTLKPPMWLIFNFVRVVSLSKR